MIDVLDYRSPFEITDFISFPLVLQHFGVVEFSLALALNQNDPFSIGFIRVFAKNTFPMFPDFTFALCFIRFSVIFGGPDAIAMIRWPISHWFYKGFSRNANSLVYLGFIRFWGFFIFPGPMILIKIAHFPLVL